MFGEWLVFSFTWKSELPRRGRGGRGGVGAGGAGGAGGGGGGKVTPRRVTWGAPGGEGGMGPGDAAARAGGLRRAALHVVEGCADPRARNFDPHANVADPALCEYGVDLGGGGGGGAGGAGPTPGSGGGEAVVLELTATHLFLLFGLLVIVAAVAAWVVNIMYCRAQTEIEGEGAGAEGGVGGGEGSVADALSSPAAPPLFESSPDTALLVTAGLSGSPALLKAARQGVLVVQAKAGEGRQTVATGLNEIVGVVRLDALVVVTRGPADGGGLSLFAADPPTTAETLAEDAGEVDFWRELGALLHPAGSLYVMCSDLRPADQATERLARELGFVAERCVKLVHRVPKVHRDVPDNLGHAAFLQSFDLKILSQWWMGQQRGSGTAAEAPRPGEPRPRTPASTGAERRQQAAMARAAPTTPGAKDIPWPKGSPPSDAAVAVEFSGGEDIAMSTGDAPGKGLRGTPPLRSSPRGIPPATTFNMARNLLKLKSKAKSKVKNW